MFQIVRLELDDNGNVIARQPLQPPYELWEDATALAEFDASGVPESTAMTTNASAGARATLIGVIALWSSRLRPTMDGTRDCNNATERSVRSDRPADAGAVPPSASRFPPTRKPWLIGWGRLGLNT
jgi:hypothetical protein